MGTILYAREPGVPLHPDVGASHDVTTVHSAGQAIAAIDSRAFDLYILGIYLKDDDDAVNLAKLADAYARDPTRCDHIPVLDDFNGGLEVWRHLMLKQVVGETPIAVYTSRFEEILRVVFSMGPREICRKVMGDCICSYVGEDDKLALFGTGLVDKQGKPAEEHLAEWVQHHLG